MPKFDLSVKYLPSEKVVLTERAKTFLNDTHFSRPEKFRDKILIPIFSIGNDEVWLGFDFLNEIAPEIQMFMSPDGVIAAMPLSLMENEFVTIDYYDGKFSFVDLDICDLIPLEIRKAMLGTS